MTTLTKYRPGDTYGEWTLLEYHPSVSRDGKRLSKARWTARCSCGVVKSLCAENIMCGQARLSCGHLPIRADGEGPYRRDRRDAKSKAMERRPVASVFDLGKYV